MCLTLWNGVPVRKSILRLRKARSRALDDASSSAATSRGSASTMVTSAPKLAQHAGELAADDAAAEHDHRGRHAVEAQGVLGGEHPLPVDLEARQRPGVGAGGQHEVASGVGGVADGDGARPGEPALALDHGDAA